MKKLFTISLFALSSSLFTFCEAQYTVLHSFNDTTGAYPFGTLTLSGSALYGMASYGGANGYGCIFVIDTNGSGYADIWDFNDTGSNGTYPEGGSLKISGNKLFGMTYEGGKKDSGVIFSINLNGTGYKDIHDFSGPDGAQPQGSLTLNGAQLFGMTFTGGASLGGNIFELDTNGSDFKDLQDFSGANGLNPYGDVTLIGGKLYGMTANGGANLEGNIFSIDTNGSDFTDLLDFAGTNFPSGQYPNNILIPGGSQFFGMTYSGGANTEGNVFSVDTNGTLFKDLLDFNGAATPFGSLPYADAILDGGVLYGMASSGGANDSGCIFQLDTNGSAYIDLYDFNSAYGTEPVGDVTISKSTLWGTTEYGGTFADGVIFKYHQVGLGTKQLAVASSQWSVYPNPSNGIFTMVGTQNFVSGQWSVEVYNELGEEVYISTPFNNHSTLIDLSSNPNGIYFYRAFDANGGIVGEGKLVVQK